MAKDIKKKSNIFCIDIDKDREGTVPGYITEYVDTTKISDGDSVKDRESINKMCTSIPTPFARLFLFRTAFKEVQERQEAVRNQGELTHDESGLYNYLVSDCLDMLEFIFYYGHRDEFGVIEWDKNWEIDNMLSPGKSVKPDFKHTMEHDRLAKALKEHLDKDSVLKNTQKIYLFTWKGVVVGGTSPFSLVYTSPNWVREKALNGFEEFRAGEGDETAVLFDNDPTQLRNPRPLSARSENFKKYIYELNLAYGGKNPSLKDFEAYVKQSYELYDNTHNDAMGGIVDESLKNKPSIFRDNAYPTPLHNVKIINGKAELDPKHVLVVCNARNDPGNTFAIPLRTIATSGMIINDDYKISITQDADLPLVEGEHGNVRVDRPLILSNRTAIPGAQYFQNRPWDSYMSQMPPYLAEEPDYWKRKLPGTPVTYPYLRMEDFLEDHIICVAKEISKSYFLTGNRNDVTYLPPLKRLFFQFIKLSDMFETREGSIILDEQGNPKIKEASGEIYSIVQDDDAVRVTLRIPVMGGVVELQRSYSEDEVVYYENAAANKQLDLSIFPFYRIDDEGAAYNKYSVMLGYLGSKKTNDEQETAVDLHFFGDDMQKELNPKPSKVNRVTNSQNVNTTYYEVNQAFSAIELHINTPGVTARGMIIPFFKHVQLSGKRMVFCVDFGTSNTHIAFGEVDGETVKPNTVKNYHYGDNGGYEVVHLFNPGGFPSYKTAKNREFVPDIIVENGRERNDGNQFEVAFPLPTQANVQNRWFDGTTGDYQLFGNVNVGFFYDKDNESVANTDNTYKGNIKWKKDNKYENIRKAYFDELMWLIKNKVVMEQASMDFYFYFTYPQSMDGTEIDAFYDYWNNARKHVKAGDSKFNMQIDDDFHPIEGIVPWFAQRKEGTVTASDRYLNIDIGGGTMDMVYQDPESTENYTFSAIFAGDDLWGDGIDSMAANRIKQNAFVKAYESSEDYFPDDKQKRENYDAFVAKAENSSQIINSLFKYDADYRFSKFLTHSELMTPILIHFAALSYYVGLVLQKKQFLVPNKIGFTGMGSLYLRILSPQPNQIAEIMKSVLRYQGFLAEDGLDDLQVVLLNNPKEVTAQGGVLFHGNKLREIPVRESYVWGFDGETALTKLKEQDVSGKENEAMVLVKDFFGFFDSEEFVDLQDRLHRNWPLKFDQAKLLSLARTSFKDYNRMNNQKRDKAQKDPIFFWAIKDLLFNYGLELIKK